MSPSVVEPISAARGGEKNSASYTFACKGISEGPVKQARAKMSQDEGHSKAARPIPIFAKIELHYLIIRLARIAPSSSAPTAIGTSPRTKLPRFIRPGDSNGLTAEFSPAQRCGISAHRPAEVEMPTTVEFIFSMSSLKPFHGEPTSTPVSSMAQVHGSSRPLHQTEAFPRPGSHTILIR